jgi:hypothetical protein
MITIAYEVLEKRTGREREREMEREKRRRCQGAI